METIMQSFYHLALGYLLIRGAYKAEEDGVSENLPGIFGALGILCFVLSYALAILAFYSNAKLGT